MEAIVLEHMEVHFEAAKSAKLLAVQGIPQTGIGWLVMRLLADWMIRCDDKTVDLTAARVKRDRFAPGADEDDIIDDNDDGEKSEVGIAIYSLKHDFDYFATNLAPFGIDLRRLEERGHFRLLGNLHSRLFGDVATNPPTAPSLTLLASLELLMEEADRLKYTHKRTVVLMDEPEFIMPLFEDDFRTEKWVCLVQGATYQFHHAIVSVMLRLPDMGNHEPNSFPSSIAAINGVNVITNESDMAIILRGGGEPNSDFDGIARIVYRTDYEPPDEEFEYCEEACVYKFRPGGRGIEVIHTYQ